jgi:hypothetical protein
MIIKAMFCLWVLDINLFFFFNIPPACLLLLGPYPVYNWCGHCLNHPSQMCVCVHKNTHMHTPKPTSAATLKAFILESVSDRATAAKGCHRGSWILHLIRVTKFRSKKKKQRPINITHVLCNSCAWNHPTHSLAWCNLNILSYKPNYWCQQKLYRL